jgi:hypothetical protein
MPHPILLRLASWSAEVALVAGCTQIAPTGGPAGGGSRLTPIAKWPAPSNPMELAVTAGLVPETVEHLAYHVHAHLDVFIDGVPVVVPAGIGINISDPGVRTSDGPRGSKAYGGITGCGQPCISPLHTHDVTGVIHTESATPTPNTLGQLFIEWGVTLSRTCVGEYCSPGKAIAFYVSGAAFNGDPTTIQLSDQLEIAIVIGTPPASIPFSGDFSGA